MGGEQIANRVYRDVFFQKYFGKVDFDLLFALSLNKIGCISAKYSSELDILHSICTIFVYERGQKTAVVV